MSAAPRILMLTTEYGPLQVGGLGAMVTSLCRALDRARARPVVALPRSGQALPWPVAARRALAGGEATLHLDGDVEVWSLGGGLLDGPVYPPSQREAIKKHDEYGARVAEALPWLAPDVVHLHDLFGYKCLHAARLLGQATVFTVHRCHPADIEPHEHAAEVIAARLADLTTTVSAAWLEQHAAYFAGARAVLAIPNGIDLDFWRAPAPGGPAAGREERRRRLLSRLGLGDRPTFAFFGRLDDEQKAADVLLDAWTRLATREEINLIVVGEGTTALADAFAAEERAAPDRLRCFRRFFPREEVRDVLSAADAVVVPSRREPFGLIQIEAMAVGALSVASRTGGLRETLEVAPGEERFGIQVEPDDPVSLADGMAEMARLTRHRPEETARRRERAAAGAARYGLEAMAARYADLYRRVTAGGHGS